MNPSLYALNVGRGDAFFIEVPVANGEEPPFIVLVDGGDERLQECGYVFPQTFMRAKGWSRVDLMILTHLHHDHIVGLLPIAAQFEVGEAVLPYPRFEVPDLKVQHPQAQQSLEAMRFYQELYDHLEAQGTRIQLRPPHEEMQAREHGYARLRHLYPAKGDPLPGLELIEGLKQLPEKTLAEQEGSLRRFDQVSNLDSSIWLLEQQTGEVYEPLLLLGGDAYLACWKRLLAREQLGCAVLKLSHHGMRDGVSPELLDQLRPNWLLITNHQEEAEQYMADWQELAAGIGAKLAVTGKEAHTGWLVSRLPKLAERVKR
ncbi:MULTISPECIES: MBL fold metallo-hydrolase [Brevibacillus]|uniref:ComEC/Rec2 family competence protein n=1 Tax=Brevibacillus TaxID=55080 RepID=UPI002859173F|nr:MULTISPECIES: MBL fold metallo-hydrolase [Brevibacillus]MDR7318258.1 hypothetical protein [Brevibacillus nitrificans]MED1953115.1 MBL fold metallo-hydrolase [Brevibacillus centrosporus]